MGLQPACRVPLWILLVFTGAKKQVTPQNLHRGMARGQGMSCSFQQALLLPRAPAWLCRVQTSAVWDADLSLLHGTGRSGSVPSCTGSAQGGREPDAADGNGQQGDTRFGCCILVQHLAITASTARPKSANTPQCSERIQITEESPCAAQTCPDPEHMHFGGLRMQERSRSLEKWFFM